MNSVDKSKRLALNTFGAGALIITSGGLLIPKNAEADPLIVLGLLNALITLFASITTMLDKSATQQVSASTEVAKPYSRRENGDDPNMLMNNYSNGGMTPLNCQTPVARDSLLTMQDGDPYLHQRGLGNKKDSSISRWESLEFNRIKQEETGVLPIPAGQRDFYLTRSELEAAGDKLGRKGINPEVWRPEYMRKVTLNNAEQSIIMAKNGTSRKTILV